MASTVNRELGELDVLAAHLDPDEPYLPVSINAPVFGATGEIELIVCLTDAPEPTPGREVHRLGRLVRDLCIELTTLIGGVTRLATC